MSWTEVQSRLEFYKDVYKNELSSKGEIVNKLQLTLFLITLYAGAFSYIFNAINFEKIATTEFLSVFLVYAPAPVFLHFSERKTRITSAIVSSIGLMILILFQDISLSKEDVVEYLFYISMILSIVYFSLSLREFKAALWGHEYKILPNSKALNHYYLLCEKTYENYPKHDELVNTACNTYLLNGYIESSTENHRLNKVRNEKISHANQYLSILIIPMISSYILFQISNKI